jgi:hypothetical protein
MNCPQCAKEIPAGYSSCPACGASVVAGDPLSAAPQYPVTPASSSVVATVLAAIGSLLCFVIIVVLSASATRKAYPSMTSEGAGYLTGRCIGAYLFPLIGVFLYYKLRHKKPSAARRVFVISAWALFLALLATAGEYRPPMPLSQAEMNRHIGALAKGDAGQVPASGNQTKWDGVLRSFFADIKSFNNDYMKEVAQNDNSALKTLYTANSFATAESVNQVLTQLHATLDLDDKYASMQPIFDKLKERVFAMDASDPEKQAFWQSFESSARASMAPREKAIATERDWLKASIDLYEFIQANQGSYSVAKGKVLFNVSGLAGGFNDRMKKATQLRSEFVQAQEAFHKAQNEKLGQLGLQPSDLGAPNHK